MPWKRVLLTHGLVQRFLWEETINFQTSLKDKVMAITINVTYSSSPIMLEMNTIGFYMKIYLIIDGILQINAINLPFVSKDRCSMYIFVNLIFCPSKTVLQKIHSLSTPELCAISNKLLLGWMLFFTDGKGMPLNSLRPSDAYMRE